MQNFSTQDPEQVRDEYLDLAASNPPDNMTPEQYRENRARAFDGTAAFGGRTTFVGARDDGALVALVQIHEAKPSQWHKQEMSGPLHRTDGSPMPPEISDHYGNKTVHVVSYVASPNLPESGRDAAAKGILEKIENDFPGVSGITMHTSNNMPPSVRTFAEQAGAQVVGTRNHQRAREFRFGPFDGNADDHKKAILQHLPGNPYRGPQSSTSRALQGIETPGSASSPDVRAPSQAAVVGLPGHDLGVERSLGN